MPEKTSLRGSPALPLRPHAGTGGSRSLAIGFLLAALTVAAYLPAMQCGFIWDDNAYVQENTTLRSLDGLRRIWFEIGATQQYYPLVYTSYWLEYRMWGLAPAGYHVVNILLHAASVILLWRVLKFLEVPGAWFAAAVFGLHPVQVESVAWITERKNVLSAVFYLSSALWYLRYTFGPAAKSGSTGSGKLYAASLVLFLLGLFSKTVTGSLPFALLLVIWWKRGRIAWRDVRSLLPFIAAGVGLGLLTVWMERQRVGAVGVAWDLSVLERSLVAGRALCFYASKLFCPMGLTFIYPRWEIDAGKWVQYVYPAAAVAAVLVLWKLRGRVGRGPVVAVLFFAGTLFPALGFFNVFPMRYSYVADHFQYLACVGVIALAVSVCSRVWARLAGGPGVAAAILAGLVLGLLGAASWVREQSYRDLETLWRDTLKKNPNAWIADTNLGNLLMVQGKANEAIDHYRRALRSAPDLAEAHSNLGNALRLQGNLEEAVRHCRMALDSKPDFIDAHNNLAIALSEQGKLDEAIEHFRRVLQATSGSAQAHNNLGLALVKCGRHDEALNHFRQASELRPNWGKPLLNIAWILLTHPDTSMRDGDQAVRLAERAARLSRYQDATVLDELAAAYAYVKRFGPAVAAAERAADLAATRGHHAKAENIRRRILQYKEARTHGETAPTPDENHARVPD